MSTATEERDQRLKEIRIRQRELHAEMVRDEEAQFRAPCPSLEYRKITARIAELNAENMVLAEEAGRLVYGEKY